MRLVAIYLLVGICVPSQFSYQSLGRGLRKSVELNRGNLRPLTSKNCLAASPRKFFIRNRFRLRILTKSIQQCFVCP